jgi:hypothetical protein
MAASMVSAVVPATVGAADASKGFAIKTYDISKPAASDAKSSITIDKKDIPADGYVIPSAVYYSEGANATDSLLVAITTDSKDISFKLYNPTKEGYTSDEKEYTLGGDTFSTSSYISFAGSYDDLDGYAAAGKYVFGIDSSQSAAGTDNYFIGCSWTNNGKDYKWAGEKSDSYPFYVFDTVIPQNIAAGEYTIKFCEYNTDASGVNDNPSPLVEGEKTRFTTKGGNLKLETMKIVVTNGDEQVTTTKAAETTTTKKEEQQQTTTTKTEAVQDGDIQFTFADKNGKSDITAEAGEEITIYANVKAGGKAVSAMDVQFKATNGLEITQIGGKATALDGVAVSTNIDEYRANFTSTDDAGEPIVPTDGKAAFTLKVKVDADVKDGTYTIGFADQCKVFKDSTNFNYKTSFAPLEIVVGEQPVVTTTTTTTTKPVETTSTTTTKKDEEKTTTTSTTTAPKTNNGDGKKVWGDANEDGDVNVCDVVLVLTYISDSSIDYFTEQGKINADVAGEKGITSEDSETLIKYCLKQINKPE